MTKTKSRATTTVASRSANFDHNSFKNYKNHNNNINNKRTSKELGCYLIVISLVYIKRKNKKNDE